MLHCNFARRARHSLSNPSIGSSPPCLEQICQNRCWSPSNASFQVTILHFAPLNYASIILCNSIEKRVRNTIIHALFIHANGVYKSVYIFSTTIRESRLAFEKVALQTAQPWSRGWFHLKYLEAVPVNVDCSSTYSKKRAAR